jgi:AcrR family transcriptional regulator
VEARRVLITGGLRGISVGKIARNLGVTRGDFYWWFASRKQLLECLLADWEKTRIAKCNVISAGQEASEMVENPALMDLGVYAAARDSQLDSAVRGWARLSPRVAAAVYRVDELRISILQRKFELLGYQSADALVRGRICYFYQVGNCMLGSREPRDEGLRLFLSDTGSTRQQDRLSDPT